MFKPSVRTEKTFDKARLSLLLSSVVSTSDLIELKLKVEQKQTVFHPMGCTFSGGEPLNSYAIILEPTFRLLSDVLFLF